MSKVIRIRDVPDDVHRTLKMRAAEQGRSLSELAREQLTEFARMPTMAEFLARVDAMPKVDVGESAADAIRAAATNGGRRRRGLCRRRAPRNPTRGAAAYREFARRNLAHAPHLIDVEVLHALRLWTAQGRLDETLPNRR